MLNLAKSWFSDIRFWLVLFFLVRLAGITQPPLEVAHNWRQTTVCMVARNFSEVDANILYPRIDVAGEKPGITGMEFPLLNYCMYATSEIFGYSHWYGRLINLIVSTLGIWFFYLLVKFFFDERRALFASLLLLSSLWFMYSRKSMPDTFAVSLVLASFWVAIRYLYPERHSKTYDLFHLLLFLVLCCAGLASKLPAGLVLAPLAVAFFDKTVILRRKTLLSMVFICALIPVISWYFLWAPYLSKTFGFSYFFMGMDAATGWSELWQHPGDLARQFYDVPLKYSGFAAFLLGIILMVRLKENRLLWVSLVSFIFFIIYMVSGGFTFIRHSYYIIPFVPLMALIAAYGLTMLPWKKLTIVILCLVCTENIVNQVHDFRIKPNSEALLTLEQAVNQYVPASGLLAINSDNVPTPMYFAHHRGWICRNEDLLNPGYREEIKAKGCKMVVVLKRSFGEEVQLPLEIAESTADWTLYFL